MADDKGALRHVNQRGVTYFLHQGKTKTGKTRYFYAKTIGEGALDRMPAGYRVQESINGVVSVVRIDRAALVPDDHLALVQGKMSRHAGLNRYRADVRADAIVIHEPMGRSPAELAELFGWTGRALPDLTPTRFQPVLKFVRAPLEGDDTYAAHRMTYRGHGGWSRPLAVGALSKMLDRYLQHLGKESFFDLY